MSKILICLADDEMLEFSDWTGLNAINHDELYNDIGPVANNIPRVGELLAVKGHDARFREGEPFDLRLKVVAVVHSVHVVPITHHGNDLPSQIHSRVEVYVDELTRKEFLANIRGEDHVD